MAVGIHIEKGQALGGDFSETKSGALLLSSLRRSLQDCHARKLSLALDSAEISTSQAFVSETDERKLDGVAALQMEFLKGGEGEASWLNYVVERGQKGSALLLLKTPRFAVPAGAGLYPDYAALYAIAVRRGLVKAGSNVLVALFGDGWLMSLAICGEGVAFARRFPDAGSLQANVKLSLQSAFFAKERRFIKADRILALSASPSDAKRLEEACGAPVELFDASACFPGCELGASERARLLLAYGISLAPQTPRLAQWNLLGRKESAWRKRKASLLRCAVLLLLAAPAFYLAELLTDKALLSSVERGRKSIAPLSSRLESLQSEAARLKGFASKQGSQLVGEDACFALFSAIDKARPQGLLLTSISGSPWGEITASGKAASYSSLLSFVERLGNDSSASSVELSNASLSSDGSISFQMTAKCVFAKEFRPAKTQEDAQ